MKIFSLSRLKIAIFVALLIIIGLTVYFVLRMDHYSWQDNGEIIKISERFKNIRPATLDTPGNGSRSDEGWMLFPLIKVGMSGDEVRALLGAPSMTTSSENGLEKWSYILMYDSEIFIEISDGKVVRKEIL